jgi:calcium-dependent protein kinase
LDREEIKSSISLCIFNSFSRDITFKKKWFISWQTCKIQEHYIFEKTQKLGTGTYGTVIRAFERVSNNKRAVKVIPKSQI